MCGLAYPIATAVVGGIYLLARIWFSVGYLMSGPKGRMYAVPFVMLTQFGLPIFTIVSLCKLAESGVKFSDMATAATSGA